VQTKHFPRTIGVFLNIKIGRENYPFFYQPMTGFIDKIPHKIYAFSLLVKQIYTLIFNTDFDGF
jgi:hypothetical protein